jgi:hypothetical protein
VEVVPAGSQDERDEDGDEEKFAQTIQWPRNERLRYEQIAINKGESSLPR